jgi:hypothetical protein
MSDQAPPVPRLACLLARYRNLRAEVRLGLPSLRFLQVRSNRGPSPNQLARKLAQHRWRTEQWFAEINNAACEQEGTILNVVRSLHAARHCTSGAEAEIEATAIAGVLSTQNLPPSRLPPIADSSMSQANRHCRKRSAQPVLPQAERPAGINASGAPSRQ